MGSWKCFTFTSSSTTKYNRIFWNIYLSFRDFYHLAHLFLFERQCDSSWHTLRKKRWCILHQIPSSVIWSRASLQEIRHEENLTFCTKLNITHFPAWAKQETGHMCPLSCLSIGCPITFEPLKMEGLSNAICFFFLVSLLAFKAESLHFNLDSFISSQNNDNWVRVFIIYRYLCGIQSWWQGNV